MGYSSQAPKEEVKENGHISDKRSLGKNKITETSEVLGQECRMMFNKQKHCLCQQISEPRKGNEEILSIPVIITEFGFYLEEKPEEDSEKNSSVS